MTSDLSHLKSVYPFLVELIFMSSSLAVILVDWNHSCLDTSLRLLQSYLPRWRKRSIRQDVYICLVLTALALMYNMENSRIAVVAIVVLISFWLQSKPVSNKCIGTQNIQLVDKSVGGSPVTHMDQASNASTCCRAGVPCYLLSQSSSGPQSEVNIEEELRRSYVEAFRTLYGVEDVTNEDLVTGIQYLNTLNGGKFSIFIFIHPSSDRTYYIMLCLRPCVHGRSCFSNFFRIGCIYSIEIWSPRSGRGSLHFSWIGVS